MSSNSITFFHGVYFAYLRAHHSQLPSKSLEKKKKKNDLNIFFNFQESITWRRTVSRKASAVGNREIEMIMTHWKKIKNLSSEAIGSVPKEDEVEGCRSCWKAETEVPTAAHALLVIILVLSSFPRLSPCYSTQNILLFLLRLSQLISWSCFADTIY